MLDSGHELQLPASPMIFKEEEPILYKVLLLSEDFW